MSAVGDASWLTGREYDVLLMTCDGLGRKQIAAKLGIAEATVAQHITRLHRKTGCPKAALLVRWAIREGLVTP